MPLPAYDGLPDPISADAVDVLGASKVVGLEFDPTETDPQKKLIARRSSLTLVAGKVTGTANTQLSAASSAKFARCVSLTLKNTGAVRVAVCDSASAVFTDGYALELNEVTGGDLNPSGVYLVPESGTFTVSVIGGKA